MLQLDHLLHINPRLLIALKLKFLQCRRCHHRQFMDLHTVTHIAPTIAILHPLTSLMVKATTQQPHTHQPTTPTLLAPAMIRALQLLLKSLLAQALILVTTVILRTSTLLHRTGVLLPRQWSSRHPRQLRIIRLLILQLRRLLVDLRSELPLPLLLATLLLSTLLLRLSKCTFAAEFARATS